jgi:hypothetical protein
MLIQKPYTASVCSSDKECADWEKCVDGRCEENEAYEWRKCGPLICWCRVILIRIYLIACGSDGDCEEEGETCVDGRCKSNESPDINAVIKLGVSSKTWHPFNKMHTFMITMSKNRGKTKSPSTRGPRRGGLI